MKELITELFTTQEMCDHLIDIGYNVYTIPFEEDDGKGVEKINILAASKESQEVLEKILINEGCYSFMQQFGLRNVFLNLMEENLKKFIVKSLIK